MCSLHSFFLFPPTPLFPLRLVLSCGNYDLIKWDLDDLIRAFERCELHRRIGPRGHFLHLHFFPSYLSLVSPVLCPSPFVFKFTPLWSFHLFLSVLLSRVFVNFYSQASHDSRDFVLVD